MTCPYHSQYDTRPRTGSKLKWMIYQLCNCNEDGTGPQAPAALPPARTGAPLHGDG